MNSSLCMGLVCITQDAQYSNTEQQYHDHLQVSAWNGTDVSVGDCRPTLLVAGHRQADHGQVVPHYRLTTAGRRAFSCAGPSVWNSLPAYGKDETLTLDSFKHSLKTLLATY